MAFFSWIKMKLNLSQLEWNRPKERPDFVKEHLFIFFKYTHSYISWGESQWRLRNINTHTNIQRFELETHRMTQTFTVLFCTTFPLTAWPPPPPRWSLDAVLLDSSWAVSSISSSPREVCSRSNSSSKIDLFLSVPTKWKAALLSLGGVADDWRVMVIWGLWLRELALLWSSWGGDCDTSAMGSPSACRI